MIRDFFQIILLGLTLACASSALAIEDHPAPITNQAWQEVVISVFDAEKSSRFFTEIAGFEIIWHGAEKKEFLAHLGIENTASAQSVVLKSPGSKTGYIRLIEFSGVNGQVPTRPGARTWDTGCFTSIMMRAKGLNSIYNDAIKMDWWTETPITELKFGTSKLKIVIFKGPQGIQVEAYERLSPPLPQEFPEFKRLSLPFNIMQTVRNREASRKFFVDQLGFKNFFNGPPVTAQKEAQMPLGIPLNFTTTSRYQAAILYPEPAETGRVELVEFMDLKGEDYYKNCNAPNFGILSIKFVVDDVEEAKVELIKRHIDQEMNISNIVLSPYGEIDLFSLKTPDGANIEFYSEKE